MTQPSRTKLTPGAAWAAVCVLNAVAGVFRDLDQLDPSDRNSRILMRRFHRYFDAAMKEAVSSDARENAVHLLSVFHHSLDQLEVAYDMPPKN